MTVINEQELERLLKIERIVAKCIFNSGGFVSAWEFDAHDMNVKPEEWHDQLRELIEAGPNIQMYCGRCGQELYESNKIRVPQCQNKIVCSTCTHELHLE